MHPRVSVPKRVTGIPPGDCWSRDASVPDSPSRILKQAKRFDRVEDSGVVV